MEETPYINSITVSSHLSTYRGLAESLTVVSSPPCSNKFSYYKTAITENSPPDLVFQGDTRVVSSISFASADVGNTIVPAKPSSNAEEPTKKRKEPSTSSSKSNRTSGTSTAVIYSEYHDDADPQSLLHDMPIASIFTATNSKIGGGSFLADYLNGTSLSGKRLRRTCSVSSNSDDDNNHHETYHPPTFHAPLGLNKLEDSLNRASNSSNSIKKNLKLLFVDNPCMSTTG